MAGDERDAQDTGHDHATGQDRASGAPDSMDDEAFEALLEDLRASRDFDFTGYKRSSLRRRIAKRMADVGVDDVAAYHDHLQVDPDEFVQLLGTILINVTSFFRDRERWDFLAEEVLPRVIRAAGDGQVRVWSGGCASGEEPYTIAMLLAELLGPVAFAERVRIYATDADEDALRHARQAVYDERQLEAVPEQLRRYFESVGSRFVVRADLRRAVIFGRHDLISDAPISNLHLLVCRNVLMYFNRETQVQVLRSLHVGLRDDGFLFLGKADMLLGRTDLFTPVELAQRVFCKADLPTRTPDRLPVLDRADGVDHVSRQVRGPASTEEEFEVETWNEEAFERGPARGRGGGTLPAHGLRDRVQGALGPLLDRDGGRSGVVALMEALQPRDDRGAAGE